MRRPVLLFLCVSLAWTLACATAIGTDGERRLWQRQLASTSARFTLVQTAAVSAVETTAAVRTTAVVPNTQVVTTPSVVVPSSAVPSIAKTPSSSTTPLAATSTIPVASSASSSAPIIAASSRTARQITAAQSNIAISSASPSSASASSASVKASAAAAKSEPGFIQPGHRLFPVAVLMFIAIGIIGVMLGIFIIKKCCHHRRFADPRDYAADSDWEKRAGSPVGLLDSPDSFNSDEKSGAWNSQQDAGMRMNKGGLNFTSQAYQPPAAAPPPRSSNSTRAHQTHRRTATIILPPTPAVLNTPTRQPSHPPHSLRPSSPLHRTPSPGNATPPSQIQRVPVPLLTFDEASSHARSLTLRSAPLPNIPPPIPMKRPFPPVPAARRAATIAVQPHQPKDGSGLRYLYGERSSGRVMIDLDSAKGDGTFGRSARMGSAEGRVLG